MLKNDTEQIVNHKGIKLIKKHDRYYISFIGGQIEEIPCFLNISDEEATQIIENPEKIEEIRDSYKKKVEWTQKRFVDSFIEDCLTYEYKLSEKRVKLNMEKLNRHEDIKFELYETFAYEEFPQSGAIEVCGYTAEKIKNSTYLSVLGAYNYLIFLKEDEKEAIKGIEKGLIIK